MIDERAIFAALIGCYAFTFLAWRNITNHLYHKLDKLTGALAALHLELGQRLTAVETEVKNIRREVNKK